MPYLDPSNPYHRLFWDEAEEQLRQLEDDLIQLEIQEDYKTLIPRLFRNAHSLKGACATMAIHQMVEVTHEMETTFDRARQSPLKFSKEIFSSLMAGLDFLKTSHARLFTADTPLESTNVAQVDSGRFIHVVFSSDSEFLAIKAFQIQRCIPETHSIVSTVPKDAIAIEDDADFNSTFILEITPEVTRDQLEEWLLPVSGLKTVTLSDSLGPLEDTNMSNSDEDITPTDPPQQLPETTWIKLPSKNIDHLIDLTTELTLHKNALHSQIKRLLHEDPRNQPYKILQHHLEASDTLLKKAQQVLLDARMLPMSVLFSQLPRMVRDLSQEVGKTIEFTVTGDHFTMDRNIMAALHDPITHLIRNAIDHGIETEAVRRSKEKAPIGHLHLSASQGDNSLIISLADDGQGIDTVAISKRALEKGLISIEEAPYMYQEDWYNLLFSSGFSTKDTTSTLSGRGVGLDIVKANINAIHGQIQVISEPDLGTTFILKLPLSLALSKSLLVKCHAYQFAIPLSNIVSIERISPQDKKETFHITPFSVSFNWNNNPVPLFDPSTCAFPSQEQLDRARYILITSTTTHLIALWIEALIREEEMVTQPLAHYKTDSIVLNSSSIITGAAVLGDGSIAYTFDLTQFPI